MAEGNNAPGSGPGQAPDRWESYVQKLPEKYRDNPDSFISEYSRLEDDLRAKARVDDWYRNDYLPWVRDNKPLLDEFETWKQTRVRSQPRDQTTPVQPPGPQTQEPIDWDDPEAPRRAYEALEQGFAARVKAIEDSTTLTRQEFSQARDHVIALLGLLQQAQKLQNEDLYQHVNYTPRRDMERVAQYAAEHGLADLALAADQLYKDQTIEQREQAAVLRAREQWEREQNNRGIRTEHGPGVPPRGASWRRERFPSPANGRSGTRSESAPNDLEGLYDAISKRVPDAPWW